MRNSYHVAGAACGSARRAAARQALIVCCLVALLLLAACSPQSATNTPPAGSHPAAATAAAPAATQVAAPPAVATPSGAPSAVPSPLAAGQPTIAASAPLSTTVTTAATPAAAATGVTATTGAATGAAATPAAASATGVPGGDFQNPVISSDFPDPDVIQAGQDYYAYATAGAGKNIQVAHSTDLVHWDLLPDALPALPSWVQLADPRVWAPGVLQIGDHYVMYYVAHDATSDKQCLGVGTSSKPEGKFTDANAHAFICQVDEGGSIDPEPFQDGNKLYLYWKNDGNSMGLPTNLYVQELSPDGMKLVGQPVRLTDNSQVWEGSVVEAPFMYKHAGRYYLFFSANSYAGLNYAVGYATCQAATGPCQQAANNPILKSRLNPLPEVIGPGGESLLDVGGQTWMFYHSWDVEGGTQGNARYMWLDRVDWQNGQPVVEGPTTDPEPMPKTGR